MILAKMKNYSETQNTWTQEPQQVKKAHQAYVDDKGLDQPAHLGRANQVPYIIFENSVDPDQLSSGFTLLISMETRSFE